MGDRRYRQRGYQDSGRERQQKEKRPQPKRETFGPRTPRMPGTHAVSRCGGCGKVLPAEADPQGRCPHCGFELHSCKQCAYFDTSARFECTQPIPARIPNKNAKNDCSSYAMRVTVERQTSLPPSGTARPDDPRKAFDNLFKK